MSEKLSEENRALYFRVMGSKAWGQKGHPDEWDNLNRLLNAARAEARPAPVVDREAVARAIMNGLEGACGYKLADYMETADVILALLSPATSPGEGSSSANRAARIASDHAASETLRKSEEG